MGGIRMESIRFAKKFVTEVGPEDAIEHSARREQELC
jgi:hypothetical protein